MTAGNFGQFVLDAPRFGFQLRQVAFNGLAVFTQPFEHFVTFGHLAGNFAGDGLLFDQCGFDFLFRFGGFVGRNGGPFGCDNGRVTLFNDGDQQGVYGVDQFTVGL